MGSRVSQESPEASFIVSGSSDFGSSDFGVYGTELWLRQYASESPPPAAESNWYAARMKLPRFLKGTSVISERQPPMTKAHSAGSCPEGPVVTSVTFDKDVYTPGDLIRATVSYVSLTDIVTHAETATAAVNDDDTDTTGELSASFSVSYTRPHDVTLLMRDTSDRYWELISDDGSMAVWTATA